MNFYEIAQLLPKLGVDIWANPRSENGRHRPDSTSPGPTARQSAMRGVFAVRAGWAGAWPCRAGLTHYGDPRHAQALAIMGALRTYSNYFDAAEVRAWSPRWAQRWNTARATSAATAWRCLKRREVTGAGVYVLRLRGRRPRALLRLTLEMQAFGMPMLTDIRLPRTLAGEEYLLDQQYHQPLCGGRRSAPAGDYESRLSEDARGQPGVQLMDADAAQATYPGTCSLYRRTPRSSTRARQFLSARSIA